jgi:hypothetical protein
MSGGAIYGRSEHGWQNLEQAGWAFLKEKAAERRGDAAHDPTVSYSDANEELAARTGQSTSAGKPSAQRWATCWAGSRETAAGQSPGC